MDLGRDKKAGLGRRRGRENQVQEFYESDSEEEDDQVESWAGVVGGEGMDPLVDAVESLEENEAPHLEE